MSARDFSRAFCIAACVAGGAFALVPQALASGTHVSNRCATFTTRGAKYGVYIADGHVKCDIATDILKAIDSGKGRVVNNGGSYNSYVLYGGWLCPFGNMGEQTCEHSKHPVNNPSQDIVSLSCTFDTGCPKRTSFPSQ